MISKLITDWNYAKKDFIKWLGDDLIFNYGPVEMHIDKEKRHELVKEFIIQAGHKLSGIEFDEFAEFIVANSPTFFDNIVSKTYGQAIKGMKLSKAFKFFIEDKETLNTIQQLASSYIQLDKIKGDLCLSVHPLDYLSLSENTYNWRSCHSLDGDYRAGNLSYMCDKSTVVMYIKGDEKQKLPNFPEEIPWYSKKWRMLIYFDENMEYCFLGRQYPYTLSGVEKMIKETFLPGRFCDFTNYHVKDVDDLHFVNDQIVLNTKLGAKFFSITDVVEDDCQYPLHYNDLLYSSYYKPYYTSLKRSWEIKSEEPPKIKVGKDIKCLCCGQHHIEPGEGLMVCVSCAADRGFNLPEGYGYCGCCGEAVRVDDAYYMWNGDIICRDCLNYDDEFNICCDCGEVYRTTDLFYDEETGEYYCQYCNRRKEENSYG